MHPVARTIKVDEIARTIKVDEITIIRNNFTKY
jgi:hypothetical protein